MKILHFGDCHLDSAWDRLPPETAAGFRADSRRVFAEAIELAKRENVDLIFCAGDVFDTHEPYHDTVEFCRGVLADAGRPVFIAPGNHDPKGSGSVWSSVRWSDNVHIFSSGSPERVELEDCAVTGVAYTSKNPGSRPFEGYKCPDSGKPELLLVHGHTSPNPSEYMSIPHSDIVSAGFAFAGVGHIHSPRESREGDTLILRCGSTEGRGFDEQGEHGCWIVTLEKGRTDARFVPLEGARALELTLRADGREAADIAAEAAAASPYPPEKTLIRVILEGESGASAGDITAALSSFAHAEVDDRTEPPRDLWKRINEDSLVGMFLREVKAMGDSPEALEVLRFGLAALEGKEQPR
ncbi:MAG: exonuclease SbcCD subunit D [Clostridia bacterium]|nr:exonuclease SbcCD subunit D [Clostridia bacterium]